MRDVLAGAILLAIGSTACGGATAARDGGAGSVDYYRTTCAGPPAMLSLGPYPAGTDGLVEGADSALAGTVVVLNQLPAACTASGSLDSGDTFRIDHVVWGDTPKQTTVVLSFVGGNGIQYYALGQRFLYLGSYPDFQGPTVAGSCGTIGLSGLDLAQYPNAAADMIKLRPFVADRKIYEQLIAARVIADALVTSVGPQQPVDPPTPSAYQVALGLRVRKTLCGDATKEVTVRYLGDLDEGVFNAAGFIPPAVGAELIVLLGPSTLGPPARYDLVSVFPDATSTLEAEWARFAELLSSPPSLSL
jgi:hypothetical protein